MKWKDEDLPALRELETAVVRVWRANPAMTDYVAERAYEAAYRAQRRRNRNQEPEAISLTGVDLELFDELLQVGERLLAHGPAPMKSIPDGNLAPVDPEKLAVYLRELQRSVQRHTKDGGRQGYLIFLRRFLN